MSELIHDTAQRFGVAERILFEVASKEKGFSNYLEVATYRFSRWFKYGEVPAWVQDYCLRLWGGRDDHAKV